MSKMTDIDELLVKSQRLKTHNVSMGGLPMVGSINRGVAELTEYSKQWSSEGSSGADNLEAFRLLGQKHFDAKQLMEDVMRISIPSPDDSLLHLEGTDIEGYLAHHHDMIVLTAVEEARQGAEEHVQEMQRRWHAGEWAEARTKFMESLGHRAYRWEGQVAAGAKPAQAPVLMLTGGTSYAHAGGPTSALQALQSPAPFGSPAPSLSTGGPPMSDLLSKHAAVVRALSLSSHADARAPASVLLSAAASSARAVPAYTELAAAAAGGSSDGLTGAELLAYRSHLQLLACAVGERHVSAGGALGGSTRRMPGSFQSTSGGDGEDGAVPPPGYFSCICLDPADCTSHLQAAAVEERRQWLTRGARSFLEAQWWDVVSQAVDEAVYRDGWAAQSSAEGGSRQQRLRSYVAYQQHHGLLPTSCSQTLCVPEQSPGTRRQDLAVPLWVFVFHCLRVGDLPAAAAELRRSLVQGLGECAPALAVVQALLQLQTAPARSQSQGQGQTQGLDEAGVRGLAEGLSKCRHAYEREQNKAEEEVDPHRLLVLNLLGLADKEGLAGAAIPGFSLEDFLWGNMWFVELVRTLQPVLGGAQGALMATHSATNERGLFELIQEYGGADYFDEQRSNPFRYAMVLCCCQRYGDAIMHLWQCNKPFPAAHLTAAALHYGLVLPHVPLNLNPPHPMIMGGRYLLGGAATAAQEPTPSAVLSYFVSTPSLRSHPAVAADYLLSLDSNWLQFAQGLDAELRDAMKARSQASVGAVLEAFVCGLSRAELEQVCGAPVNNARPGVGLALGRPRTAGRLDDYLRDAQVGLLLSRAAFHLSQRQETEAALHLYLLAGRYCEVVEELCARTAAVLMPHFVDERARAPGSLGSMGSPGRQLDRAHQQRRESWRVLGEEFIDCYLRDADGAPTPAMRALTQGGARVAVDSLVVLASLFPFVDAVVFETLEPAQALRVLDELQVLPSSGAEVEAFSSALSPMLRGVVDDLLLIAMECTCKAFQGAERGYGGGGMSVASREMQLQSLRSRASALAAYAQRIRGRLGRQDTAGVLAQMQAKLV
ncbi:hypothetical protein B484DRAFT_478882 [Ochromonadaceae sp. CCMP2298]|nr:hypothetical protein B484DRAFT_478882 [Ochromonadaceae sp. CCMP2298]|mmetsp:Transcript_13584/g.29964  ORF Transcript_13584/g.29964 Transcript_13584/m.29964 type:complete len:1052 (+) Transcript_13584:182-3337(+)|eukprot:CAMPEP_0173190456 /NCGR_PEP_ID=MMETSP1141-20130122/12357_1 /TAXON_ID=483371 /ORGANISM="non described non described, Strain CCMP2298" /LENGTH=1051 /DNA_ID=CAMNT_0014114571 /DNA_START=116 /DNA_END=3271 /DNA_ORIENTATION=+